jgi:hypothetical protein
MSNVQLGGTLYIKCKDCKLLKRPFANDVSFGVPVLQPGTKVQWLGPAFEDKAFQKIRYGGQIGYVLTQNLGTSPVKFDLGGCKTCGGSGSVVVEWGASQGFVKCSACDGTGGFGKPMSAQAYASHGAGTKG